MGKNMCNKLVLKKQLYSLRMQKDEDAIRHIQRFDRMSMELLNIEVELEEEDESLLLLCLLRVVLIVLALHHRLDLI